MSSVKRHEYSGGSASEVALHQIMAGKDIRDEHVQTTAIKTLALLDVSLQG